jgi:GH24 family phage-related lysozyme (muramidase)
MPYNLFNSNGSFLITIDDNVIDTTTTSVVLFGKDLKNYGDSFNKNYVNLLQNFAATIAPSTPSTGQLWYDTTTQAIRVFDKTIWNIVGSSFSVDSGTLVVQIPGIDYYRPFHLLLVVVNFKIISIFSYFNIKSDDLPVNVSYNDNLIPVRSQFPNGINYGENLAIYSNVDISYHGTATVTDRLTTPINIGVYGDTLGNVEFDGTSNINLNVTFDNVRINNSNISTSTAYSNVTVNSSGRVINQGNLSYNDIVAALTYIPYSSSNVSASLTPNSLVYRDDKGNFSANLITATTTYSKKFASNTTIRLEGDVDGSSQPFNGTSNIVINSNLISSASVLDGVYNELTVNQYGLVEAAKFVENMPLGAVVLYNNSVVIPEGWAKCDGAIVNTPAGSTVNTPNYSNISVGGSIYIIKVFSNKYLPSNDTVVGTLSVNLAGGSVPTVSLIGGPNISYPPLVFSNINVASTSSTVSNTYTIVKNVKPPEGFFGSTGVTQPKLENGRNYKINDVLYIDYPGNRKAEIEVKSVSGTGGITSYQLKANGRYNPFSPNSLGSSISTMTKVKPSGGQGFGAVFDLEISRINQPSMVQDVVFGDNLFFDAVSLVLSNGDTNAVMLSQTNIFGDVSNLSILQVINNLQTRYNSGLPPRIGKYMLSLDDIKNYAGTLNVPVDITNFTVAVQNRLMLIKVTDIANRLAVSGYYPSDDKIFGACYIGFSQYIAILKGVKTETVGKTLNSAGFNTTGLTSVDNISNDTMLKYISIIITNAKTAVFNNKIAIDSASQVNTAVKKNLITVPKPLVIPPLLTTGNANIIITESVIDGLPVFFGGEKPSPEDIKYGGGAFTSSGIGINDQIYKSLTDNRYISPGGGTGSSGGGGGSGGGSGTGGSGTTKPNNNTGTGTTVVGGGDAVVLNGSDPTLGLIRSFEGFSSTPYYDVNAYRLGYGTDTITLPDGSVKKVTPDDVVTREDAERDLARRVATEFGPIARNAVGQERWDKMTPGQQAALTSIAYNYGEIPSRIRDAVKNGTPEEGAAAIRALGSDNGGINRNRRNIEADAYLNGVIANGTGSGTVVPGNSGGTAKTSSPDNTQSTGVTVTPGGLVAAVSPTYALVEKVVSAVVPQSIKDMVNVSTEIIAKSAQIAQAAGTAFVSNATALLNKAIENSGQQPPSTKPSTSVGGTVVNAVRPSLPTSGSSSSGGGSSSSSGGGGGGADSGQAANRTSTPGTISGVSANNNGSISVAAAPSTRNPTSSATYGISNSPSKPSSGGTGTSSKPSGGGGADSGQAANKPAGTGCFVYETEIEMADGTTKQIGTIRLGDQTRGGEVLAIHCYDGAPLYNYQGVHVSGTHYVFENGEPIMVQDSECAEKIDNVYGLYTIDTTERRIFANGIEFADHNGDGVIFDFFKNSNATTFNSEKEIFDEVLRQVKDAKL